MSSTAPFDPNEPREAMSGPYQPLNERGVEYVEVRCVDLNPFEPLGINAEQIRFMDTFLLLCLLSDSPADSVESRAILGRNQTRVVKRGREPGLQLEGESGLIGLRDWATTLFDACEPIAAGLEQSQRHVRI